jgi:shikimate dehydrogenase
MFDNIYSGATRLIFIAGDPIAQVKSPAGVTEALRARGADSIVVPAHVKPEDLAQFLALTQKMPNCDGHCITVPHKFAALGACATLSPRARSIGAVNAIRRNLDGTWHGEMCDGEGYVAGLRKLGCEPQGKAALLVGAGGAGSAIAHALVDADVARMSVYDADARRLSALIEKLRRYGKVPIAVGSADAQGFDLAINATPMGMKNSDTLPIDMANCAAGIFIGCVVTQPVVPPLIEAARAKGYSTMTGADMFASVCERLVEFYLHKA